MPLILSLVLIAGLITFIVYQHRRYCMTKDELAKIKAIADRFIMQTEVILNRPRDAGPLPIYQAHSWHGVSSGNEDGTSVNAFIELVPTDVVKPEVDKETGILRLTRPQKFSSTCPMLYGFVPRTYCGEAVAALAEHDAKRTGIAGDGDPLDICVLSERPVSSAAILVRARPIGGFRMIDGNEADDKIIAVLETDDVYGGFTDLKDVPMALLERLRHYFETYKQLPGPTPRKVEIVSVYGRDAALEVIRASRLDYQAYLVKQGIRTKLAEANQ